MSETQDCVQNPKGEDRASDGGAPIKAHQCGSNKRGRKGLCRANKLSGAKRCRLHGGAPGSGRPITTGRRSVLHGRLREAMEAADEDERLEDPRRTVAQIQAAVSRLSELVEENETPEYRRTLLALWEQRNRGDEDEQAATEAQITDMLERGAKETDALREFASTADRMHTGVLGTWKVRLSAREVVNSKHLQAMFAQGIDAIGRECEKSEQPALGRKLTEVLMRLWMPEQTEEPRAIEG